MTQPVERPHLPPQRRRRPWLVWAAGTVLLAGILLGTVGGYELAQHYSPAPLWDTLMLRAYLDRPLDHTAPGKGFWVSGYYVDYDHGSLDVVTTRSTHMDQVIVFGYGFDQQGNLEGRDDEIIKGLVERPKRVILFGNLTDGGFDEKTAHAILTDKSVQDRAIANILAKVKQLDAGGVQMDFENMPGSDRAAYTAFLTRLKGELQPLKMTLTIAAAAKTYDEKSGWGGAIDYAAVGQIVDQIYIMAYDEHWQGGEPGPIASLNWTEQVIRYATGVIPAQKIILGLPFYGYEWATDPKAGKSANQAFGSYKLAQRATDNGGTIKWDPVSGENVATYKVNGSDRVAWWPDERSLQAKLKLAYQYNVKGVALWRLGFEDDAWWDGLGAFRLNPIK